MTTPYAAGALYSTVDDLLIWDQALYSEKVLKTASLKAMFTDYGSEYGFGWGVGNFFGHRLIVHSGGINGFVTRISRYPDDQLTVIVLSNDTSSQIGRVSDELSAIYLGIPPRTAVRDGDKVVRRMIEELRRGAPDYTKMGQGLADVTKVQLPSLQKKIGDLGPLKTVMLMRAEANGIDRYKATFEKGALEYGVKIEKGGKVTTAFVRPAN